MVVPGVENQKVIDLLEFSICLLVFIETHVRRPNSAATYLPVALSGSSKQRTTGPKANKLSEHLY
jgi:hypothetical protein